MLFKKENFEVSKHDCLFFDEILQYTLVRSGPSENVFIAQF